MIQQTETVKTCRGCGKTLPLSEFHRRAQNADGYQNFCKACVNANKREYYHRNPEPVRAAVAARRAADPAATREYDRRMYRKHRTKLLATHRAYAKTSRGKAAKRKSCIRMRKRHGHKMAARRAVLNAIRDGTLIRPIACDDCGDGGKIEGHHHNGYEEAHWLDVVWLCDPCHKKADAKYPEEYERAVDYAVSA